MTSSTELGFGLPASQDRGRVRREDSSGVRIVAFGGGTGISALLRGLKRFSEAITAVVTVTDNGGSSGRLRNDFDILAPGDIRNCLVALADVDPLLQEVFQYRFDEAEFKGHCFGNLFITVLARLTGSFDESVKEMNRLLRVKGRVIPASGKKVSLVASHPDGTKSTGEVEISHSEKPIKSVELRPSPVPLGDELRAAVENAELFLFGPGSLYTSVIPNLLVDGMTEAIRANGSPRVYLANIMTQPGETEGFTLSDHLEALSQHVGRDFIDGVVAHAGQMPERLLARYRKAGAVPVEAHVADEAFPGLRIIRRDVCACGETVRHDPARLAEVIHAELLAPIEAGEAPLGIARGRVATSPRAARR